eukprot:scaffold78890_cov71-Phaeocystis_antarctica.AAC.1
MITIRPTKSGAHALTVSRRKLSSIAAKRTCFKTASSSASGRSEVPHQRLIHWKTASSLLASSRSSCTSASTCVPEASCGGSSSKPPSAESTAAFSSACREKASAIRHTSRALVGESWAAIIAAHAALSGSTISRADASSISVSWLSSISQEPSYTKVSSALSTGARMPSSECAWSAASRMPESKRLRKYPELEASTMRCALHSTPSAQTTMSVKRESRQSEASTEWCGSPPLSVSLGAARAAVVRARFLGGMFGRGVKAATGGAKDNMGERA